MTTTRKSSSARRKEPILLKDSERYRLWYGPYEPPRVKQGFLVDAIRGKIRFDRFTNARIPWPLARRQGKGGSGGFILCGDLMRALEKESAPAISYHWGVSRATVGNWRRALHMKGRTQGAQKLVSLGVELARLPQSRKKIAAAARGRVLSSAHKSRLFAGIRKGWKERFDARRAAFNRTGRFPKATKSDPWIPEEESLLTEFPTAKLVSVLGRTFKSIQARRLILGLSPHPSATHRAWKDSEVKLLGTASDSKIAKRLGRTTSSVEGKRRKLGIKPFGHLWTAKEEAIVGKFSDVEASRRLGRSVKAVQHRRIKLGLAFYHVDDARKWTAAEEAMLGTDLDQVIAKRLHRTVRSVAMKRRKAGIRVVSKVRPWTSRELKLLGTESDVALAKKIKRSVNAIRTKREKCLIEAGSNRRWTRSEDKLLGTMPDAAVAKKLDRLVGAVRMRRTRLHIPIFSSKVRLWEKWELKLLGTAPDAEVARRIDRAPSAVKAKRQELRIPSAWI